jgi:hypothetical protein
VVKILIRTGGRLQVDSAARNSTENGQRLGCSSDKGWLAMSTTERQNCGKRSGCRD